MAQRICSVDDCDRIIGPGAGRGYCSKHYQRWRANGDVELRRRARPDSERPRCDIAWCDEPARTRGWCANHYARWHDHGDPTHRIAGEVRDGCRVCPRCDRDRPLAEYVKYTRYCDDCGRERRREWTTRNPQPRAPRVTLTCALCSVSFDGDRRRSRYCSKSCGDADKNRVNWKNTVARRVRIREALVETFDRVEIFERDEWTCGLCGDRVDPVLPWPEPMSASLDHVIPLSKGGQHSRANAQCTHLICNLRKGKSQAA